MAGVAVRLQNRLHIADEVDLVVWRRSECRRSSRKTMMRCRQEWPTRIRIAASIRSFRTRDRTSIIPRAVDRDDENPRGVTAAGSRICNHLRRTPRRSSSSDSTAQPLNPPSRTRQLTDSSSVVSASTIRIRPSLHPTIRRSPFPGPFLPRGASRRASRKRINRPTVGCQESRTVRSSPIVATTLGADTAVPGRTLMSLTEP